jgi:5-formyltetrahydrofolate cyclo-ligase
MNNISLAKEEIRRQILKQRALMHPTSEETTSLTSNLLTVVRDLKSSRVATYISYPSEPGTADFIEALLAQEVTVLVPKTLPKGILSWHNYSDESEESLSSADVLFLPALAVDEKGNRLGRGKGYFDRELSLVPDVLCYAVVFESEVLESIPVEAHDKSVDGVVTQERIRKIN